MSGIEVKKIYLLIGDEKYKINEVLTKLIDFIKVEKDGMNYTYLKGKSIPIEDIKAIITTLPFLSDKRLVILDNTNFINRNAEYEKIVENIPDSTVLVIIEDSIDARKKENKFLISVSRVIECTKASELDREKLLNSILASMGKKMDTKTRAYILENSEQDLYSIVNNVKKVCSATDEVEIDYKIVKENVEPLTKSRVFEMVSSIIKNQPQRCIELFKELIELKEEEMRILSLLMREFRIYIQIMSMDGNYIEVAKKIGVRDFVVKNARKNLVNISKEFLSQSLDKMIEIEIAIKAGSIDKKLGLQKLILELISMK